MLFKDIDLIKWKQDLKADQEILNYILEEAKEITPDHDSKLKDLKEIIEKKLKTL